MNLRKLAPLGPCDGCGCIRRCRPVESDQYECLECTPAGEGKGDLDRMATGSTPTLGGRSK